MKTTLSATRMAFWRNARNWEKGRVADGPVPAPLCIEEVPPVLNLEPIRALEAAAAITHEGFLDPGDCHD
ncbi:MAG: hypothetical protein ACLQVX_03710 [Limisphaerales bacterium]